MPYNVLKIEKKPTEKNFWSFVKKRQNIWFRRYVLKKSFPWTRDPILKNNRFCEVYRENDYGTRWTIENILNTNSTLRQRLFATVAYRCCNRPATFDQLGIPTLKNWKKFWKDMCMLSQQESVFSSAYRCSAFGSTPRMKIYHDILQNTANDVIELTNRLRKVKTLHLAHASLCNLWGVGPFIAYEIVNDLMYTDFFPQGFTENDFVIVGPGASHALKHFWGHTKLKDQMAHIEYLRSRQIKGLGEDFPWYHGVEGDISLANLEGAICEFRKYINAQNGGGHLRRYSPDGIIPARRTHKSRANLDFLQD